MTTDAPTYMPARLWRDHPRETLGVGLLGFAAALALAGAASSTPTLEGIRALSGANSAPPAPPPMEVRRLAPEAAVAVNAAIPVSGRPGPAARPFALKAGSASYARALECLTSTVYYEAGQESAEGQRAVAQVVLNRVRHPAFPASVCGVVYQGSTRATGCQFTFTCDGSLYRRPEAAAWERSRSIARAALAGAVYAPVGWATHYHANYVVPYWAPTLAKGGTVGAHIFYRWAGGWGRPAAFTKRHAGSEPNVEMLRAAALAAEATQAATAPSQVADVVDAIPGAEPVKPADGGRVGIRFNLAAREAVEKAVKQPYVEKFEASDNLRWSLGAQSEPSTERALGKAAPAAPAAAVVGSTNAGAASAVAAVPR